MYNHELSTTGFSADSFICGTYYLETIIFGNYTFHNKICYHEWIWVFSMCSIALIQMNMMFDWQSNSSVLELLFYPTGIASDFPGEKTWNHHCRTTDRMGSQSDCFLFLSQTLWCNYWLESSHRDDSNEWSHHGFWSRNQGVLFDNVFEYFRITRAIIKCQSSTTIS